MDKRQYSRFSFNEAIAYQTAGETSLSGALGGNISQGGVRIRIQKFIPLRTLVYLKIHLTNPERNIPVKGQVVWIMEVPHSDTYDAGIEFLKEKYRDPAIGEQFHSLRFDPASP